MLTHSNSKSKLTIVNGRHFFHLDQQAFQGVIGDLLAQGMGQRKGDMIDMVHLQEAQVYFLHTILQRHKHYLRLVGRDILRLEVNMSIRLWIKYTKQCI